MIFNSLRELCKVVREPNDVLSNVLNYIRVVNDVSFEVLETGTSILGGEEEDRVDPLSAVFDDSHNADGVGHLHLGTFGVPAARGVKYADDILSIFNHNLLAVPSYRLCGLCAHNVLKDRVILNLLGISLNVAVHCNNHFSPSQELDGSRLSNSSLA